MSKKTKITLIILIIVLIIGISIYFIINKDTTQTNTNNIISTNTSTSKPIQNEQTNQNEIKEEQDSKMKNIKVENIKIKVNNEVLTVKLNQNSSTEALVEKLQQGDITVNTQSYGDFEHVGSLGFSLPTSDTQITTKSGDIMLYQGNQITLFYGTNSWSYTKLGEVIGEAKNRLKDILESENATLVLSIN